MKILSVKITTLLLVFYLGLVSVVWAEDAEEKAPKISKYYDLKPSFVTNFGSTNQKKLKFVKADVSIRTSSDEAITNVMNHDALVRHQIVMLLSRQPEAKISSSAGQEDIRVEALNIVKEVLEEETGSVQIDDLMFTSFVVQR